MDLTCAVVGTSISAILALIMMKSRLLEKEELIRGKGGHYITRALGDGDRAGESAWIQGTPWSLVSGGKKT
jgi:hypothetical protein